MVIRVRIPYGLLSISFTTREAFFMVYVYVIESLLDKIWYKGMAIDPIERLKEHNAGKNRYTKGHRPWKIIYTEPHKDWKLARPREQYLKTSAGHRWLEKYLNTHGGDTGSLPA